MRLATAALDPHARRAAVALAAALLATLAACICDVRTISSQRVCSSPDAFDTAAIRNLVPLGDPNTPQLSVDVSWSGDHATATLRNLGSTPVPVHDVVLFDWRHDLPGDTAFYGEGFQMLSQTAGTIANPLDLEQYTDRGHYQLPEPAGFRSVYGVALFSRPESSRLLVGFASCRRFVGRIDVSTTHIRAVIDGDGVSIEPGETWPLEDLVVASGPDRDELFARLSYWIERNHPRRPWPSPPRGWCSWYCFGPNVTAKDITETLKVLPSEFPKLEYVQIDDGYQPAMGDWLDTARGFHGEVEWSVAEIKKRGLKPALWIAPFIASADSKVFREHPDWFVWDEDGTPLRSDKVGFGGWRQGPWYCLDGTNPAAREHLATLFRTLRVNWGIEYFKLDANYWGAIRGKHYDPRATRISAYREGMQAVREGAGDAFLLGCNHPMWGSLGLLDGSRSSMDIERSWESIARTGRQNLLRVWQNGRLWWNDPDCVLLAGVDPGPVSFLSTVLFGCGGLVLSGDDLRQMPPATRFLLRGLLQAPPRSARFDDALGCGRLDTDSGTVFLLLNWSDREQTKSIALPGAFEVQCGLQSWNAVDRFEIAVPPRSGKVLYTHHDPRKNAAQR